MITVHLYRFRMTGLGAKISLLFRKTSEMRLKYKNTTLYKDYITLYNMDHNRLRINSCETLQLFKTCLQKKQFGYIIDRMSKSSG